VALLVPAGQPVTVAIDDALFRRRGKKVRAAGWSHGGSAPGRPEAGYDSNWVIAAVIVRLPMVNRGGGTGAGQAGDQGHDSASRLWLGRRMAQMLAGALASRDTHVVAGAAAPGKS
jgi:hypothetical protein